MLLDRLSIGKKPPEQVNVVIEIPQGSSIKYELDKESGALVVDRFLATAMSYPFNYGFIPHTHAEDGDPVDILLISAQPVAPGSVVAARPIGMLEMEDEAGIDTKILAVPDPKVDASYADITDAEHLGKALHEKITHFFTHYKELEKGKWVKVRKILGRDAALESITKAMKKA